MILIPDDIRTRLLANGAVDCETDHVPVVKLFNPCGAAVWLITEMMDDGDTLFGLCDLGFSSPELGYISLAEIESVKNPLGLGMERDLYFMPRFPLSVYTEAARIAGHVTEAEDLLCRRSTRQKPRVIFYRTRPARHITRSGRRAVTTWSVQCGYAAYYANTVTVEANTLDDAFDKAITAANEDTSWKSLDHCGPTFVDAVAEGAAADLWRDHVSALPVPERFTERAAAVPLITVIVEGGVVQDVIFENGPARVIVCDYDTDGADPAELDTDGNGDRYVPGDWSNEIPPSGG